MHTNIIICDNIMSLYLKLKPRLPEFNIELVTLDNLDRYENIFYCNLEYYLITEGHPAAKRDCIPSIFFILRYSISSRSSGVYFGL